jgi:predicted dehydrogenase
MHSEDAMEVRWGIVGLGRFAPAIEASETGRLTACAGTCSKTRLKVSASRHGVGAAYLSHEELVRDPESDAVYIAAPNALHHPIVLAPPRCGQVRALR